MTQHLESREPRDGYAEGLVEIGAEHDDVFVLDGDCAKANYTTRFQEKFPDRFFNLGIAECDIVGTAAGMAAMGKVPFANAYGNFLTGRGFDQVRVSVAYSGRNAKIVGHNAGTTAAQEGATHLPLEDVAIMRALPEMTVIVPCDAVEMRKAVHAVHALDVDTLGLDESASAAAVACQVSFHALGRALLTATYSVPGAHAPFITEESHA